MTIACGVDTFNLSNILKLTRIARLVTSAKIKSNIFFKAKLKKLSLLHYLLILQIKIINTYVGFI